MIWLMALVFVCIDIEMEYQYNIEHDAKISVS